MFFVVLLAVMLVILFVGCFCVALYEEKQHLAEKGTVVYIDSDKGSIVKLRERQMGEDEYVYVDSVEHLGDVVKVLSLKKAFDYSNTGNLYAMLHSGKLRRLRNKSFKLERFVFAWNGECTVRLEKKISNCTWIARKESDNSPVLLYIQSVVEEHTGDGKLLNANALALSQNDLPVYHTIH